MTHVTLSLDRAAMEVRFPPRPVLNCLLGSLRWGGPRPKNNPLKNILQQEMGEKKQKTRRNPPSLGNLGLVILRKIRFFFRVSKRLWLFLLTFCVDEDKCCDGDAGVVPMPNLTTLESCCISASFLCKAVFKVGFEWGLKMPALWCCGKNGGLEPGNFLKLHHFETSWNFFKKPCSSGGIDHDIMKPMSISWLSRLGFCCLQGMGREQLGQDLVW